MRKSALFSRRTIQVLAAVTCDLFQTDPRCQLNKTRHSRALKRLLQGHFWILVRGLKQEGMSILSNCMSSEHFGQQALVTKRHMGYLGGHLGHHDIQVLLLPPFERFAFDFIPR